MADSQTPQKQRTLSSATIKDLDIQVNAFIGRQLYDTRYVDRRVTFAQYYTSGGTFYAFFIYEEIPLSN